MSRSSQKVAAPSRQSVSPSRLSQAVDRARNIFANRNLRFTALREQVFTEIAATTGAIGAYDILEKLSNKGTRLAPISVYRSIDALLDAGVIHRLESKNAYFACRRHEHGKEGRPIFLSCEKCGAVTEAEAQRIFEGINEVAHGQGFQAKVKFVEVSGICARCAAKSSKAGEPAQ
ncbi:MAG: transcriptional repressor [Hyphomicrobiaceae bacterium]|nr:transcriptional repressor [Hyphomicrobiaceae bacterium]MCC0010681.1 transcriptional repressor [Hyphomicrobiaceae bacterium]